MLISLWTWGLVWPGQTNIPIGKQIVKVNLFKKVTCAKERGVCVWFFSPHTLARECALPTAQHCQCQEQSAGTPVPLSPLPHVPEVRTSGVHTALSCGRGGEHYLRYRCRMGSLFIHFQDASHKFTAEWLRSLKNCDVALLFQMFLLFALCIFISSTLSRLLH